MISVIPNEYTYCFVLVVWNTFIIMLQTFVNSNYSFKKLLSPSHKFPSNYSAICNPNNIMDMQKGRTGMHMHIKWKNEKGFR